MVAGESEGIDWVHTNQARRRRGAGLRCVCGSRSRRAYRWGRRGARRRRGAGNRVSLCVSRRIRNHSTLFARRFHAAFPKRRVSHFKSSVTRVSLAPICDRTGPCRAGAFGRMLAAPGRVRSRRDCHAGVGCRFFGRISSARGGRYRGATTRVRHAHSPYA